MTSEVIKPMQVPHLRKLGLFSIILASLWAVFFGTVMNPNLVERDGQMIFMAVLGGLMFVSFLNFTRETKKWKKKTQQSLGK